MNDIVKMQKLTTELSKYTKYCKCGHSITIVNSSRYKKFICSHCGNYVYKNDYEEFKDKLNNAMLRDNCI